MPREENHLIRRMLGSKALFSQHESREGNQSLSLDTQIREGQCPPFLPSSAHHSTLVGPDHAQCCLWLPLPHLPYGQERVKGMVWASYKFPISVGRVGLLAERGLGLGGEGELGKSQEVVSR